MSFNSTKDGGMSDLLAGLKHVEYWAHYAWHDVKQRYKRSALGPFWITISMSVTIIGQALLFSLLFGQNLATFLPYIAAGQILWALIVSFITDSQQAFIGMAGVAKNVRLPLSVHYFKFVLQQVILLAHNIVPLVVLQLILHRHDYTVLSLLCLIPSFILLMLNCMWMGLAAAVVSSRFRDLGTVISSVVQLAYFATPILWPVQVALDKLDEKNLGYLQWLIRLNPFYQMMEILRRPILADLPYSGAWAYLIVMAIVGWTVTLWGYRKTYRRIVYWL
jgi:ABC-type polysaccharide/polyol phosphate export permease